jgi:hypothetical protein
LRDAADACVLSASFLVKEISLKSFYHFTVKSPVSSPHALTFGITEKSPAMTDLPVEKKKILYHQVMPLFSVVMPFAIGSAVPGSDTAVHCLSVSVCILMHIYGISLLTKTQLTFVLKSRLHVVGFN